MASFFKSCFRPCLGSESHASQAPNDVHHKTPTPGPAMSENVGTSAQQEKRPIARKGPSWADFLDKYRKVSPDLRVVCVEVY